MHLSEGRSYPPILPTAALRQQRPVKNLVPPHGARTADKELLSALGPERNLTFVLLPRSRLSIWLRSDLLALAEAPRLKKHRQ